MVPSKATPVPYAPASPTPQVIQLIEKGSMQSRHFPASPAAAENQARSSSGHGQDERGVTEPPCQPRIRRHACR
jgi:hypothetical protein